MSSGVTDPLIELAALHQANVQGMDALQQLEDPDTNFVVKRPWIDEPSGAIPFDKQDGITVPALASIGPPPVPSGFFTILTLVVPDGYDGVIKYISNNVNFGGFVNFSGDLVWKITADNKPIRNFENILNEKGTIQIARSVSPIRIYSGQTIRYEINHVANPGLAGQTIATLNGYFYPAKGVS